MSKAFYSKSVSKEILYKWRQGQSIKDLTEEYNYKTSKSIIDKLKKGGVTSLEIKNRRYEKPWSLSFEELTPFSAYLLGLIATDGYVLQDRMGIDLTDEDCISFISKNTNKKYHQYSYKSGQKRGIKYRIVFNGKEIVKQLNDRGIYNNKSRTIGKIKFFPKEKKYMSFFLRGVIDGDGTIGKTSGDTIYLSVISYSKSFIKYLQDCFESLGMKDLRIYKDHDGWDIFTSKKENIEILKEIYNIPYGMQRKRNKLFTLDKRSETIIEE